MTELRWHPAAAREAQAARRWYRIKQDAPEVAQRFQSMLLRALTVRNGSTGPDRRGRRLPRRQPAPIAAERSDSER